MRSSRQRSIVAAVVCIACASAWAAELPRIVTGDSATPAEQLARQELHACLAKMNATQLVVQTAAGPRVLAQIVVCGQDSVAAKRISPAIARLPAEGFALALRGDTLYVVGADQRSILYAAYDLLDRLGCRWLAPSLDFYKGNNEYVPQVARPALSLAADVVCTPALKFRKLYVEEGRSHNAENLRQMVAWMPRLRFNTLVIPIDYQGGGRVRWDNWRTELTPELQARGITIEVGGHGYQNFLNADMEGGRYYREHPEWFAKDDKGERTKSHGWVICSSNPDAVAKLQANVIAYLKSHTEIEIFDFWPPDGARWCTCDRCASLGPPPERHALLVSQIASALKKELPKVRVECIAYASYVEPPTKTPIDKSVLVDFCPILQSFETQIYEPVDKNNERYVAALKKWRASFAGDISIYSYYRKYAWRSRPNIIPHYMQKDLQFYRSLGINGVSSYAEPADWFTYELNHYVLGHLAWNPDVDVDAVIHEFCKARYGEEAGLAGAVFEDLEAIVRHGCRIPGTIVKTPAKYDGFLATVRADREKVAAACKRCAADAALAGSLHRMDLMLEYAERDLAIQRAAAAKQPTAEKDRMAEEMQQFLGHNADEGVFCWRGR